MEFFNSAIEVLQTLVVALGAGLGVWGAINLLEGYGNDNPGSKSQGMKQLMAGGGVALVGIPLIPLLSGLFGEEPQAGFPACTYAIAPSLLWITALIIIGSELQTNIHPSTKGGVLCSF